MIDLLIVASVDDNKPLLGSWGGMTFAQSSSFIHEGNLFEPLFENPLSLGIGLTNVPTNEVLSRTFGTSTISATAGERTPTSY